MAVTMPDGLLRALQRRPSKQTWAVVCAWLESLSAPDSAEALGVCAAVLDDWPAWLCAQTYTDTKRCSKSHWAAPVDVEPVWWPLLRTMHLCDLYVEYPSWLPPTSPQIKRLELEERPPAHFIEMLSRFPGLEQLQLKDEQGLSPQVIGDILGHQSQWERVEFSCG